MPSNATKSVTSRTKPVMPSPTPGELFARQPHIRRLTSAIALTANDRIDKYISAANKLKALRAYFDATPDLGVKWWEWARHHLPSKDKNLPGLLQRIADAPTLKRKEAILRVHLKGGADRARKARQKRSEKAASRHRTRTAILYWAENANLKHIKSCWKYIERYYPTDPDHRPRALKPRKSQQRKTRRKKTNVQN